MRGRLLAVLLVTAIFARPAAACSCGRLTVAESRVAYQRIFVGRVVDVSRKTSAVVVVGKYLFGKVSKMLGGEEYDSTGRDYGLRVKFEVGATLKGAATKTIEVSTGFGGGDCGYRFEVGRTYLIYAYDSKDRGLGVGICSRTGPIEERHDDLAELQGGT